MEYKINFTQHRFSFFPNVIQPPIAIVSNIIYGGLVKIGLCRKVVKRFDISNPTGVTVSVPGVDQHDMERRRYYCIHHNMSEILFETFLDKLL